MQNCFGPFYFAELKPYNSKYCSNFVLFLACSWYSRPLISQFCLAREICEIKGTLTLRVLQYNQPGVGLFVQTKVSCLAGAIRSTINSVVVIRRMTCRSAFLDIFLWVTLVKLSRSLQPAQLVRLSMVTHSTAHFYNSATKSLWFKRHSIFGCVGLWLNLRPENLLNSISQQAAHGLWHSVSCNTPIHAHVFRRASLTRKVGHTDLVFGMQ